MVPVPEQLLSASDSPGPVLTLEFAKPRGFALQG